MVLVVTPKHTHEIIITCRPLLNEQPKSQAFETPFLEKQHSNTSNSLIRTTDLETDSQQFHPISLERGCFLGCFLFEYAGSSSRLATASRTHSPDGDRPDARHSVMLRRLITTKAGFQHASTLCRPG